MKILIVCSGNRGRTSPFVKDQEKSLSDLGIDVGYFLIKGKGILGYIRNLGLMKKELRLGKYDLIHAHYGLSGCLSVMQRMKPVITTFHGGDIDIAFNKPFSIIAMYFSSFCIFVNNKDMQRYRILTKAKSAVIPCGVDFDIMYPISDRSQLRKKYGFKKDKKIILFSSSFYRQVKNYP